MRVALLVFALVRYDAFVFGYRNSFLIGWDLPLIRVTGKRVISVFHGSDSRPPFLNPVTSGGLSPTQLVRETQRTWRTCRRFERWSHVIVCGPLSAHFFSKPVVAFQHIGIPVEPGAPTPHHRGGRIRVLHAPSNPTVKGTASIRAAMESLRHKGYDFDYVELTDRPNDEVLREIDECAFVVDQLYSDTTLAGFAAEAASRGRAAVVGGHCLGQLTQVLGLDVADIAAFTTPSDFERTVQQLLDDPERAIAIGTRAEAFVSGSWTPELVAERMLVVLSGEPPGEWLFDPADIRCAEGMMPPAASAQLISDVVAVGGRRALCLAHHEDLEQLIFARTLRGPRHRNGSCV